MNRKENTSRYVYRQKNVFYLLVNFRRERNNSKRKTFREGGEGGKEVVIEIPLIVLVENSIISAFGLFFELSFKKQHDWAVVVAAVADIGRVSDFSYSYLCHSCPNTRSPSAFG
jgi:hypothetical protein